MLSRRIFLQSALAVAGTAISSRLTGSVFAQDRAIRLGYVTPASGALAQFSEPDAFVVDQFRRQFANGISINGRLHPVQVLVRDSRSSAEHAAAVARQLILADQVDLLLASGTPDTTNPVARQAELRAVACVTNEAPWQSYYFGQGGNSPGSFYYGSHFSPGLDDIADVFLAQWSGMKSNGIVGAMWPDEADGNGWTALKIGLLSRMGEAGFKLVDTGGYPAKATDFYSQISAFKLAGVEILTGAMLPVDFSAFWLQARNLGFRPKIVTIARALEFPQQVSLLGDSGDNLCTEVYWHRRFPFLSSMTGQSCEALAAAYEQASGQEASMALGAKHALFEVAADALKRMAALGNGTGLAKSIRQTRLDTVLGRVDFSQSPAPGIAVTSLVGGQWQLLDGKLELQIVNNEHAPHIPLTAAMRGIV